jgi:3-hydroxyacyl-CoA dehydrogenase
VPVDPATIVRIAVGAMANAGARLLETGGAARPSDVDIAAVHGIGLARWRGGPMFAADLEGPLQMRNLLRGIAEDAGEAWAPAAFWDGLIREGRRFADLAGD